MDTSRETWSPEPQLRESLEEAVPEILASQHEDGRFGTDPWVCRDQNVLLPLAAVWQEAGNPYYHNDAVLQAIVRGGDALIDAADPQGRWVFGKKDGSQWGMIYMPWTYSRWVRAYAIVRDAVDEQTRARWDQALERGYAAIARKELRHVHNIPTHHAMGLYFAGVLFDRSAWRKRAKAFMERVVREQSPHGYWMEHKGPVVAYNFVYVEALGVYYSASRDQRVLPALERAAEFHAHFTYPDGSMVETVDGRNPYHRGVRLGNPGFSFSAAGRGWLAHQHGLFLRAERGAVAGASATPRFDPDYAAGMLLYADSGPIEAPAAATRRRSYRMGGEAMIQRTGPWFCCLSAFTAPQPLNRWGQDRQNFLSLYHDHTGLIVGGGNTKMQPLWSSFTVGDTAALAHREGDEDPDWRPQGELVHLPVRGRLEPPAAGAQGEVMAVRLVYETPMRRGKPGIAGRIAVELVDGGTAKLRYELVPGDESDTRGVAAASVSTAAAGAGAAGAAAGAGVPATASDTSGEDVSWPVEGHVTLVPRIDAVLQCSGRQAVDLREGSFAWSAGEEEGWIGQEGWRLSVPAGCRVVWPALPHNPYRKAGQAELEEGRVVVILPLSGTTPARELTLQVEVDRKE